MCQIGVLALGAGHGIGKGGLAGGVALLDGLGLPALHGDVVYKHRAEGHDKQAAHQQGIEPVGVLDLFKLLLDESGVPRGVGPRGIAEIIPDGEDGGFCGLLFAR